MYDGIHHWSTGTSTPFNPDLLSHFPRHLIPYIADSLRSQSEIGWHQALKGYISTHWTILASFSMAPKAGPDNTAAGRRIKAILRGLHDYTRRLWQHRNSVLHSTDIQEMADIRSQAIAEIKYYHSNPSLLLSTDQHHCNRSLSQLLSSSAATRRRWLRIVKRSSVELTKDGTRQTVLTSFFPSSGS